MDGISRTCTIHSNEQLKEFDAEQTNEPVNTDMIDMFNAMVDEMFEYGRDILNAKEKTLQMTCFQQ